MYVYGAGYVDDDGGSSTDCPYMNEMNENEIPATR